VTVLVMFPLASRAVQKKISGIIVFLVAIYIPLLFTLWSALPLATTSTIVGFFSSSMQISFFASPLLGMREIIRSKNAASIDWIMALLASICGGLMFIFGLALKDVFIAVPNALTLLLGLTQVGLCILFPARDVVHFEDEPTATAGGRENFHGESPVFRVSVDSIGAAPVDYI